MTAEGPPAFDRFFRYNELSAILKGWAQRHPTLLQLESIGKSYEGRDIWLATVHELRCGRRWGEARAVARCKYPRRRGNRLHRRPSPHPPSPERPRARPSHHGGPRHQGLLHRPSPQPRRRRAGALVLDRAGGEVEAATGLEALLDPLQHGDRQLRTGRASPNAVGEPPGRHAGGGPE